ncbi:MAG: hypothetical protein AB1625_03200 [Acidobacteriota bacterium]
MPENVPVVLRFRDGRVVRGEMPDDLVPGTRISASDENGATIDVHLSDLKGIFYLKQQKDRLLERGLSGPTEPVGTTATLEFEDGEVLSGRLSHFDVSQLGFFLHPADASGNNAKIYVVTAAVRSLELRP